MTKAQTGYGTVTVSDDKSLLTVLLVDDSPTVRESVRTHLESEGICLITAADGFEALACVVQHRPSLVLVDIMMPRLDGYQTCALIKNNADLRHIPVIMLSSLDGVFDKARERIVGSDDHLPKPFTRESLLAVLRRHSGTGASSEGVSVARLVETDDAAETSDV